MAEPTASGFVGTHLVTPDVLIIGGGITGLWALKDLCRLGYTALLLERCELGGEQTCHSHVYIHRGYLYNDVELARHLKEVDELWQDWLADHPPPSRMMPSHFGFRNAADAQLKIDLWEHPSLELKSVEVPRELWPSALRGSTVQVVRQTPELCLDGAWLVRELSQGM